MDYFSSNFRLGMLGGGQLGKMLLNETQKWDIQTAVLDASPEAPAKVGCNHFSVGDLMDFDTVYQFGKQTTVLTIEIEHVNIEALEKLEKEGILVYPQPIVLKIIQNKALQKRFYKKHQIPTAPFEVFGSITELKEALTYGTIHFPFVWKSAQFGYDGNGVKVVRQLSDLEDLNDAACIAETLVPFKNELAVIVARSASGEVKTYPVVEMEFHPQANQVEYVICPARISSSVAEKAQKIALQVSEAFGHVGLLAVELFQTHGGEILVNEVAPRPHNSGHYSIEASLTNQFEQHLRAVLNLPLGATDSLAAGIMVNLVGEAGFSGDVVYENIAKILKMEGVTPHIYGKKQTRPFRKMGHVTIVHSDLAEARKLAETVKKTIRVIAK